MAGAAVVSFVMGAASEYVAEAAAFALLDAGLAVGAELAVGGVIGAGASMVAVGMVGNVVRSAFSSPPGSVSQQAAQGTLINSSSNVAALPVVYGSRRIGGTRVLLEPSGSSNEYLHIVLALGEGEINAITQIYLDDTPITDAKYSGLVASESYTGTDAQAASAALIAAVPTKWTSAHTGAGAAYVYLRLKYDGNVFRGLPTITCDVLGRKLYDPRTGLATYSNNPALAIRDYLTNSRYGRGISVSLIDDASIIVAANHCDELVAVPGGNQARYTCDGLVDINSSLFDNVKSLLSSCRGMLIYSGGKYKLVIDKLWSGTPFAFTEDNITGNWTISQPGRRSKFNRISAGFYNAARTWQQDIAISDSPAYRTADNGLLLEQKLDLPYTADIYRAQQIAGLVLKQSRFGISVKFSALQEGLRAEVGDVVTITHSTPGWTAKKFRVIQIDIKNDEEVDLVVAEYDDTVYNLDTLTTITGASSTSLPDVFTVSAPGAPLVTESLYQTTGSAGVKVRATMSWAAVVDPFVNGYLPEYKLSADSAWIPLPKVATTSTPIDDLAPGVYSFRVRAENSIGVRGAYSATTTKELLGLTAAPATISGFSVTKVGGVAVAAWTLSADLDVRLGGRIVVRHSPLTTGATWNDGIILEEFNGDAVTGLLPLITGTYMAKAKDSSANYSASMTSFVATEGMVTGFTTVATSIQHPGFTGARTNVAVVDGILKLDSLTTIDAYAGNIDTWPNIDSLGGIRATGSYAFSAYQDFGAVATRRLESDIKLLNFDTADLIDSRTLYVDDWDDIDGSVINDTDATLFVATTNDDPAGTPAWGPWTPFFVADVTCRAAKYRLDLVSASATHNLSISTLLVDAKTPA